MIKMYVIFAEHCMEWTHFAGLKGNNCYKKMKKANNFKIKSETGKWSIASYNRFIMNMRKRGLLKKFIIKLVLY